MENKQENRWTVYVHINKTNFKKYVGITSQKPANCGWAYKISPHFNGAIEKYGRLSMGIRINPKHHWLTDLHLTSYSLLLSLRVRKFPRSPVVAAVGSAL